MLRVSRVPCFQQRASPMCALSSSLAASSSQALRSRAGARLSPALSQIAVQRIGCLTTGPSLSTTRPSTARPARIITTEAASQDNAGNIGTRRVAYQGSPGAYSEMASCKACPDLEPLPCEQFETAFQALSQWSAERAVLPIENSLGGSIHTVYDLLLKYRLHIVGETSVAVNHCLLALPGVEKSDLKRVMSHPQALAQVDNYTRKLGVERVAADDTAGSAKFIAEEGLRDVAAVASKRAAELYGLNVLEAGIQDMQDNVTRFLVLSRDPLVTSVEDSANFKTSVAFSLQEGPGMLFKALSVFALRDIDLTKIESRPMRDTPLISSIQEANGGGVRSFNYLFYIDFIGALADPRCQNALRHLQEIAPFLRVLGTYPRDMNLGDSIDQP